MKKGLQSIKEKHANIIDEVLDETINKNGYWIYLKYGWINRATGTHMVHEWTLAEVEKQMNRDIEKCDCKECTENQQEVNE